MLLLVVVEVVLGLQTHTSPPKKIILAETDMMVGFRHIIVSAQLPPWIHFLVVIINQ